jgi:RNA polymerase sigma factor (sigma-70 family)
MITEKLIAETLKYLYHVCMVRGMSDCNAKDAAAVAVERAVEYYKEGQGASFKTFAVMMLNQHGWKAVARQSCPISMTVGAGNGDGTFRVAGIVELDGERQDGRSVADTFEAEGNTGFEATLLQESDGEAVAIAAEDDETVASNVEMLTIALEQLPAKLAYVVKENYIGNRTLESLAVEQGVTKQAVSLQVKKGLAMLREVMD